MPYFKISPRNVAVDSPRSSRGVSPSLIPQSGVRVQMPTLQMSQGVQPVQGPSRVHDVGVVDPWAAVGNVAQAVKELAYKKADDQARLNASKAVRQTEDRFRDAFYGDGKTPGFAAYGGFEAMNNKNAYFQNLDSIVEDVLTDMPPNMKRHALPSILGMLSNYKNMGSSHAHEGQKQAKIQERQAQYAALMQRVDDQSLSPDKAIEEIVGWGSTLTDRPESLRNAAVAKAIADYSDLAVTKSPDRAFPLLMALNDLSEPLMTVEAQTKMNKNIARAARALERFNNEQQASVQQVRAQQKDENARKLFGLVADGKPVDWKRQQRLVEIGALDRGTYESQKAKHESRDFISSKSPFEMAQLKQDILTGLEAEDIRDMQLNLSDEKELMREYNRISETGRREEIAAAERYMSALISDTAPKMTRFLNTDVNTIKANARKDLIDLTTDPDNKKSPHMLAQEILSRYGVTMDQPGNYPSIVLPGGEMYRPTNLSELAQAARALADAANDIPPERQQYLSTLIEAYEKEIRAGIKRRRDTAEGKKGALDKLLEK